MGTGNIFGWEKRNAHRELSAALNRFDQAAVAAIEPFLNKTSLRTDPARIYHYTDYGGLHGIVQSGLFRFTDVFAMNDPSEVHHGMQHSARLIRERVEEADSKVNRFFLERYEHFLKSGLPHSAHYNVCCFSVLPDSLSQWRAYADNGMGYALGFDAKALEIAYAFVGGQRAPNRSVFHVTYDDEQLVKLHRLIVHSMFTLIELPGTLGATPDDGLAFLRDLSTLTSLHALHASLYFKHEAYRDEGEYRFLTIEPGDAPLPDVKRILRRHELVKYSDFNWWTLAKDALSEIIVGPAAPAGAEKFARECLEAYGYPAVTVRRSTIPYRTPHR